MSADKPEIKEVKLGCCGRCGVSHSLKFQPFINGTKYCTPGTDYTHWAICEYTSEPVLMKEIVEKAEEKLKPKEKIVHDPFLGLPPGMLY